MTQQQPRPILMSTPMVLSLPDEAKTQTRRTSGLEDVDPTDVVRGYVSRGRDFFVRFGDCDLGTMVEDTLVKCPYGGPGAGLWVREATRKGGGKCDCDQSFEVHPPGYHSTFCACWPAHYVADGRSVTCEKWPFKNSGAPPIHMPRAWCRFILELTEVRVERVQSISEADARAEGIRAGSAGVFFWPGAEKNYPTAVDAYRAGWIWLNGQSSWDLNPWVWVLSFRQVKS